MYRRNILVAVVSLLFAACGADGQPEDSGSITQRSILVLADTDSDENQIRGALTAIYFCTPPAAAQHLSRHFISDDALIRGLAYQAAINLGQSEQVRDRVVADVESIVPEASGNKQLLLALATIEEPDAFIPRVDGLRLRRSVDFVARTANAFLWSGTNVKEALIGDMLKRSADGELTIMAARYMFENNRIDLLRAHLLVGLQPDPFEIYTRMQGWGQMTSEQRAAVIGHDQHKILEEKAANPVPWMEPIITPSVECWGYSIRQEGSELFIEGPR